MADTLITGLDTFIGELSENDYLAVDNGTSTSKVNSIKASRSGYGGVIASLYASDTYSVGDYVIHEGLLYKCITDITAEEWTTSHWEQVILADDIIEYVDTEVRASESYLGENILPTDTASGSIASFPDGTDLVPCKSLQVALDPIQGGSGTPSPDNVRPISGRTECVTEVCGKNLWDETDTVEHWIDTDGNEAYRENSLLFAREVTVGQTYTLSNANATSAQNILLIAYYGASGNLISRTAKANGDKFLTVAVPTNAVLGKFCIFNKTLASDIQLELGSTATDYEAFDGDTYTTDLGRTVYGGTLDVVTGELVVDRAMVTYDGTENWSSNGANLGFIRTEDDMRIGNAQSGYCNRFATISNNGSFGVRFGGNNAVIYFNHITDNISDVTDLASWKTWLANNPTQIVYPLATPQTYQLTPTEVSLLLGQNNVWSDGDVVVTYNADIQRYIEKKLS